MAITLDEGPGTQYARFSGQDCASAIAGALRGAGLLPPDTLPPHLGLGYLADASWQIDTSDPEVVVQVNLSPAGTGSWQLSVAPAHRVNIRPVVIRRPEGSSARTPPSATHAYGVACTIHKFLSGAYQDVRWAIDGDPDQGDSSSQPVPPDVSA